jgi:outer membrane murein-binding lipoprotein Lpp
MPKRNVRTSAPSRDGCWPCAAKQSRSPHRSRRCTARPRPRRGEIECPGRRSPPRSTPRNFPQTAAPGKSGPELAPPRKRDRILSAQGRATGFVRNNLFGAVAQLVRVPDCRSGGCGFESRPPRFRRPRMISGALFVLRTWSRGVSLRGGGGGGGRGRAANLETLTPRLEASSARLDTCTANFDTFTAKVDAFTAKVNTFTAKFDTFTARLDTFTAKVDTFTAKVDTFTAKVDTFTARLDAFTANLDTFTAKVDASSADLGASISRLDFDACGLSTHASTAQPWPDVAGDLSPLWALRRFVPGWRLSGRGVLIAQSLHECLR